MQAVRMLVSHEVVFARTTRQNARKKKSMNPESKRCVTKLSQVATGEAEHLNVSVLLKVHRSATSFLFPSATRLKMSLTFADDYLTNDDFAKRNGGSWDEPIFRGNGNYRIARFALWDRGLSLGSFDISQIACLV